MAESGDWYRDVTSALILWRHLSERQRIVCVEEIVVAAKFNCNAVTKEFRQHFRCGIDIRCRFILLKLTVSFLNQRTATENNQFVANVKKWG
jgi:gluconate kinase